MEEVKNRSDQVGAYNKNDFDSDGINNDSDNCPLIYNPNQKDSDGDGIGDFCDNCPLTSNSNQEDFYPEDGPEGYGNGVGDVCEGDAQAFDTDEDLIKDVVDNCPEMYNPKQLDSDNDGIGDECDKCENDPNNKCQYVTVPIIADAGTDQTVYENTVCYLNGSNSKSYAAEIKSFQWDQINGKKVVIQNSNSSNPFFTAPKVEKVDNNEILIFKLSVSDNYGNFDSDTCEVKVIYEKDSDTNYDYNCFISSSSEIGRYLIFSFCVLFVLIIVASLTIRFNSKK